MRAHILDPTAAPFRLRNPATARALSSPYAPAVGASLAGLALGVYPSKQLRVTAALYTAFRALEFGWNCAEDNGMLWGWEKGVNGKPDKARPRPWWWGSWMLQPFAFGQLFHALVFDRDCFPSVSGVIAGRERVVADLMSVLVLGQVHLQELDCLPPSQAGGLPRRPEVATSRRDCR